MKKLIAIVIALVLMLSVLTGCCRHVWYAASCTAPQTCSACGKTEGEALGHTWVEATCETAKTCSTCNAVEGEALGHTWEEATTELPQTCSVCAKTEGERIVTDARFTTAATKELQGKWTCEYVMKGADMGMEDYIEEIPMTLIYEFKNNGEMTQVIELNDQLGFIDALTKLYTDVFYESMAASGYNKTQADEACKQEMGMTVEEYVKTLVNEVDYEELFGAMSTEGVYYVTDGKVWQAASWLNEFESSAYTLDGDTLIIEEDVIAEGEDPLVWTRVK